MKAIVLKGKNLKLEEREPPLPRDGEVRIRIRAVGFNPVDWKMRDEWFGKPESDILGSDASGVVDMVGNGVKSFNPGDQVYAMTMSCCSNGSYTEYICIPEEILGKKPSNLSLENVSAVPLAAMTAYRLTLEGPIIHSGDSVLIAGAGGGVGGFVVQLAQIAGAKDIFTFAHDEQAKKALHERFKIPLENILVYQGLSSEEMKKALLSLHGGQPFDVTLDLVGKEMSRLCFELTKSQGHFATIVSYNEEFPPNKCKVHKVFVGQELLNPDKKTWGIYHRHLEAITSLFEKDLLKIPPIQNLGSLSVETVEQAHTFLRQGHTKGKLIMTIP